MIAFEILPLRAYVGEILRGAADVNGSVSSPNQPPQLQEAEICSNARIAIRCIKQIWLRTHHQLAAERTIDTPRYSCDAQNTSHGAAAIVLVGAAH